MKSKLIAIVGPTATGKSAAAVALAAKIGGEVVSADSAQVYRGLDIGSGKMKPEEMVMGGGIVVPHHLLDIVEPDAEYSIAQFQKDAAAVIASIRERGNTPILCGGSGLYVHSVVNSSYQLSEDDVDMEYRSVLKGIVKESGLFVLYTQLAAEAPSLAAKIHPNDEKRIIRALEKCHRGHTEAAELHWDSPYNLAIFGLYLPREALYRRIEERVDRMLANGLIDEVRGLLARGVPVKANALSALGYKEIAAYLQGKHDLDEAVRILKRDTRHFAKRQLTWFMRDPRIIWINIKDIRNSDTIGQEIYKILMQEN